MLGYLVYWAAIDQRDGRCAYSAPQSERRDATILLAGGLAQWRADPASPPGRSDARRIAAIHAGRYRHEAEALVTRHWLLIEDVASRLLERGWVSGVEVAQVCVGMRAEWCS
jgi:hypothetical protein